MIFKEDIEAMMDAALAEDNRAQLTRLMILCEVEEVLETITVFEKHAKKLEAIEKRLAKIEKALTDAQNNLETFYNSLTERDVKNNDNI